MLRKKTVIIIVLLFISATLLFAMGQQNLKKSENIIEVTAVVLEADNSDVIDAGISKIGGQFLTVRVLKGDYKNKVIEISNELLGKLDFDTVYNKGDKLIVALMLGNGLIKSGKAIEHYRIGWEIGLAILFFSLLIGFARIIGLKAIFSFVVSIILICRVYIPLLLEKHNPIMLTIILVAILAAVILFSIAGFTPKGVVAFLGTISGLVITLIVTFIFGWGLRLYGYTSPFSESLLFSGHLDLDIRGIFYSAIILGSSGAAMDIAIDVAAAMEEVRLKRPDLSARGLVNSGINIGRDVIGTMTTTLLLAYSGGYLTLLMLFYTKSTSLYRLLNLKIIAAEIMRTLVGSIGLVIVAPITALVGGFIYSNTNYSESD